jgi:hypothetical protein
MSLQEADCLALMLAGIQAGAPHTHTKDRFPRWSFFTWPVKSRNRKLRT